MLGQLCELPLAPGARAPGACEPGAGAWVLVVPVVVVPLLDEDVEAVAALAIAAPPPTRAPVTARDVMRGFSRCRIGFTSFVLSGLHLVGPASDPRRREVRVPYESDSKAARIGFGA